MFNGGFPLRSTSCSQMLAICAAFEISNFHCNRYKCCRNGIECISAITVDDSLNVNDHSIDFILRMEALWKIHMISDHSSLFRKIVNNIVEAERNAAININQCRRLQILHSVAFSDESRTRCRCTRCTSSQSTQRSIA